MAIYLLSEATAARRRMPIYCLDDTDGRTPETGLTFVGAEVQVSKAGGAFANFAGTVTELADGLYYYEPTTGELDTLGMFLLKVVKTGVRTFVGTHEVHAINLNDAVRAGLTALPNANAEAAGGLYTRGSGPGQINQDADGRVDTRTVAMAADTITATALAASAVTEIQAGLATSVEVAAVQADTDNIQTRLPVALVGGRIDASVGAMAADTLTATALATSAVDEIADGVWDEARSGHVTPGSFGEAAQIIHDGTAQAGTVSTIQLDAGASAIDDFYNGTLVVIVAGLGVGQSRFITDYTGATTIADVSPNWVTAPDGTSVFIILPFGSIASTAPTVAQIVDGVWDEPAASHVAAGSMGELENRLDATITSRASAAQATAIQADVDDIQTRLPAALVGGRIDASVGAMAADTLTATALAASAVTEIQAGLATSVEVAAVQADTDNIQTRLPAALVGGRIDASVGAMAADTLTATALATSAVDEIVDGVWDEAAAGHAAAGSMGELENRLDATITSRASAAQATAIQADVDDIQTRLPAALVGGRIDASVGAMEADTITATALAASAVGEVADGVWDEPLAGHLAPGSTGEALDAAASGGSPAAIATAVWSEVVPGAFGAGSAGAILGTNLDATVSSRAVPGAAMDLVAGAVDAGALAASGVAAIVDGVWDEPIAGHLLPGSTGEALDTAGSGGLTPAQSAQLLEIWQIHGLEIGTALIVDPASRTAGPTVVQAISTVGSQVTVTRTP